VGDKKYAIGTQIDADGPICPCWSKALSNVIGDAQELIVRARADSPVKTG
jgi:hypothetical protein